MICHLCKHPKEDHMENLIPDKVEGKNFCKGCPPTRQNYMVCFHDFVDNLMYLENLYEANHK